MKNIFFICVIMLLITQQNFAQESVIHGQITDERGNALENIVIKLENSNKFTETNEKGLFQIKSNTEHFASISHINYKTIKVQLFDKIKLNCSG